MHGVQKKLYIYISHPRVLPTDILQLITTKPAISTNFIVFPVLSILNHTRPSGERHHVGQPLLPNRNRIQPKYTEVKQTQNIYIYIYLDDWF